MNAIEKLTEMFRKFPGIGPRQAKRFVYFLLSSNPEYLEELSGSISKVKSIVNECENCSRFFVIKNNITKKRCEVCEDLDRDKTLLMVVTRDTDFDAIEKSNTYNGLYFILGGNVPILDKEGDKKIRSQKLLEKIKKEKDIKEIILALSATPEGNHTSEFIISLISEICKNKNIKISFLGRGISTGAEIEYIDEDTIKNALRNRY